MSNASATARENKILRDKLAHMWKFVNVIMEAWGEQAAMFIDEIKRLEGKVESLKTYCDELKEQLQDAKRLLAMHENYNNPDRGTKTAHDRQKHRQALRVESEENVQCAMDVEKEKSSRKSGLRHRGGQPGSKGMSCGLKPDRKLDDLCAPETCVRCGRTDIIHLGFLWKMVLEIREYGDRFCTDPGPFENPKEMVENLHMNGALFAYMEASVPAICLQCEVIIYPETPSIPGSSCGPILREKIMNLHGQVPPVQRIHNILAANHHTEIGTGTISKCLKAISQHATHDCLWVKAPRDMIEDVKAAYGTDTKNSETSTNEMVAYTEQDDNGTETIIMTAHSEPPVAMFCQQPAAAKPPKLKSEDSPLPEMAPVPDTIPDTHMHSVLPPLFTQIYEMITMAPNIMWDESNAKVAGHRRQTLVLLCPGIATLIKITDSKSKNLIQYMFPDLLGRPLQADMYLAGNAFDGDIQTCRVHLWRRGESLAVLHGIHSPEQTYSEEHLNIFRLSKRAGERITQLAGGPLTSICEVDSVIRAIPGLSQTISDEVDVLNTRMLKLIDAYRYGEVSDEDTRKYATSLENALPYMFTFLWHPGMQGHTNDIERLIKKCNVLPRKMQGGLPDWTAAKTQANLQTIHANSALWGVFSGQLVSGYRGSWKPPPSNSITIMSPSSSPSQRPRPHVTEKCITKSSDPLIQAHDLICIPKSQNVKVAAA